MTTGTVLVLADDDAAGRLLAEQVIATVPSARIVFPVDGPEAALTARTCAAIQAMAPVAPLTIVAIGEAARLLPAVALSQRAAHRRVDGYVLVEPHLPAVTESWPDAPVTVVSDDPASDASLQGRLRSWPVLPLSALPDGLPTR